MDPTRQTQNDSNFYSPHPSASVPQTLPIQSQFDEATQPMNSSYFSQGNQVPGSSSDNIIHLQEDVSTEHSFFYKPPNELQIYNISCKEIPVSFGLVLQLLNNNNNLTQNSVHLNNLHEFHFLKIDEERCYKVTCELISHSLIIPYLNRYIHGIEIKQDEYQRQGYVEFSRQRKENLEYHLKQFLTHCLSSK